MGDRLYSSVTSRFTSTDPLPGGTPTAYIYPQDPIKLSRPQWKMGLLEVLSLEEFGRQLWDCDYHVRGGCLVLPPRREDTEGAQVLQDGVPLFESALVFARMEMVRRKQI